MGNLLVCSDFIRKNENCKNQKDVLIIPEGYEYFLDTVSDKIPYNSKFMKYYKDTGL